MLQPQLPVGLNFQDEKEYRYFLYFREETATRLSTGFEPSLWSTLIADACEEPAVRQLSVAVAALSLAMENGPSRIGDAEKSSHHQYGLQRYGEALKGIQSMVVMGQDSMRTALISALLIFCLESLQGNPQAIIHVQSAIEMTARRILNEPHAFYFSRISTLGTAGSPRIEQDLLTAFMRLDRPALTLLTRKRGTPQPDSERIFNILCRQERLEIPSGFATITEARVYLEDIKWRILTDAHPPVELTKVWDTSPDSVASDHLSVAIQLKEWYEASGFLKSSSFSRTLAHWHDAFSPILNYAMSTNGESLFVAATILHIQALAADLLTSGIFSEARTGLSQANSIDEAKEESSEFPTVHAIVSMSRRLVAHHQFCTNFVFDVGIIPALVDVWLFCPFVELKIEAIEVLESMIPRREGYWDSRTAAKAGRRHLE